MDIEGITPEQLDSLIHKKDMKIICKRGGISTLRFCSFASVQGQPDGWIECAKSRIGAYPMFLRPVNVDTGCMHMLHIARNAEDLKSWIRSRPKTSNYCVEYLVEECLENGYEFVAIASNKTGLIGTFTMLDPKQTFFTSITDQSAYAIEYLTPEQTRDALPGVESFIMQKANHGKTWESVAVESLFENVNGKTLENGYQTSSNVVINFPISEGVLLHQTAIARRKSRMRVAWRVAEGEELLDADSIDDNVLQVRKNVYYDFEE
uniref:Uncharacterized protein n=1 Tax=Acrobeloides nanus TaxID=290746 RepID=A0A914ELQ3_9BILA